MVANASKARGVGHGDNLPFAAVRSFGDSSDSWSGIQPEKVTQETFVGSGLPDARSLSGLPCDHERIRLTEGLPQAAYE